MLAFQYLLRSVTPSDDALLDQAFGALVAKKVLSINNDLRAKYLDCIRQQPDKSVCEIYQQQIDKVNNIQDDLNSYVAESPAGAALLKLLMCATSNMENPVSPFWKVNPIPAYFGWPADPILVAVEQILVGMGESTETWNIAVPGLTYNYTDYNMTRRLKAPTVMKTGKKNSKEVGKYLLYNNQSTQYVCLSPLESGNFTPYEKGQEFPACPLFQYEWSKEQVMQ